MATTEVDQTTTTEEIEEVANSYLTPIQTGEVSKPLHTGETRTEEVTPTEEETEGGIPKLVSNRVQQITMQINRPNKDKNQKTCVDTAKSQVTPLKTVGLYKQKTK